MKRCPYCAEEIQEQAVVCRYCGRDLAQGATKPSPSAASAGDVPRVSGVFAKVSHLLALGWTLFCISGAYSGILASAHAVANDKTGFAAIGTTIGMGVWLVVWFLPLVGLELIAIASNAAARNATATKATAKREWQIAWLVAALPLLLVIGVSGLALWNATRNVAATPLSTRSTEDPAHGATGSAPESQTGPLVLEDWDYRFKPGDYGNHSYNISVTLRNTGTKEIKLIDASVQFADLLDQHLFGIKLSPDAILPSGQRRVDRGDYGINQFMTEQARMKDMKKADIKATLVVRRLVFSDNSVLNIDR